MVPTGLVPAVLFHGEDNGDGGISTSRSLVWESDAILYALDEQFPDTPRLMMKENNEFATALEMQERLQLAGVRFAYGGRNQTLADNEKMKLRNDFETALDELNTALGEQQQRIVDDGNTASAGCFRLGTEFSGVDAMLIPTLERWRYQLPVTENLDILRDRIHLRQWFNHLDSFLPYSERVAGDEYSWTATASQFLRYFGGGEDKPEVAAAIERADSTAKKLANEFSSSYNINTKQ